MNENKKNLPNFLIVGAAKAGTTSLYHYLKQHPQIYLNDEIKESFFLTGLNFKNINSEGGYYNLNAINDVSGYQALFDGSNYATAIGEVCVGYLYFYKKTIPNIKRYLNDPKIIIILRNPVDRAYSNYLHFVRDGFEKQSFEDALNLENVRENASYWWGYQYKKAGLYYKSVKTYLENFSNIRISIFEDFINNPRLMLQNLLDFLEVNYSLFPNNINEKYNVSGVPRNKSLHRLITDPKEFIPPYLERIIKYTINNKVRDKLVRSMYNKNLRKSKMNENTRTFLKNYYREDVLQLQKLIDRDLSHWLK